MTKSKKLTIFEGPDGSGKSTAVKQYAEMTGAKYVHFGPFNGITDENLARQYVDAMMPALMGYQDVVFDRCWLSEMPYGTAFRNGKQRLTTAHKRMLERLAMRCGAVVVKCDPGLDNVVNNYLSRKHLEMLSDDNQLTQVYKLYAEQHTSLPTVTYNYNDYAHSGLNQAFLDIIDVERYDLHAAHLVSAGNTKGSTAFIVPVQEHTNIDSFYQYPFISFDESSVGYKFTECLSMLDIEEQDLFFLNSDQSFECLYNINPTTIVAFEDFAVNRLSKMNLDSVVTQWNL